MAPVVLDSDDDGSIDHSDLEENVPLSNVQKPINDQTKNLDLSPTIPNGTSSSERLHRAMRSAHIDLLNQTPATKKRERDDSKIDSGAPDARSSSKRVKYTDGSEAGGWSGKVEVKVPRPPKELNVDSCPNNTQTDLWNVPNSPNAMTGPVMKMQYTNEELTPLVVVAEPDLDENSAIATTTAKRATDELSMNPQKKRKLEQTVSGDELGADELSVGAPKEIHHTPSHHSRFPSVDSVDNGKMRANARTLEPKTRERISRRTKVMNETSLIQDITALEEMGFHASQAERALKLCRGNVEEAIEQLFSMPQEDATEQDVRPSIGLLEIDTNSEAEAETRKNGPFPRPQEVEQISSIMINNKPACLDDLELVQEMRGHGCEEHHQPDVASRGKKGRGRPKMNATSHDPCDSKTEPPELADADGAQGSTRAKKRGRGRPKKLDTSLVSHGADQKAKKTDDLDDPGLEQHQTGAIQALGEVDVNTSQGRREEGAAAAVNQPVANEVSCDSARVDKRPCGTPPGKEAGSPSKQHSPVRASGVPFKVGLSKKARIEPLLRMVKR